MQSSPGSPNASFASFGALPTELRRKIWAEALSEQSVWAATCRDFGADQPSFSLRQIGPARYGVGQACGESRALMEEAHAKKVFGTGSDSSTRRILVLLSLDTSVVYFSNATSALAAVEGLGNDALAVLRHIVVPWCHSETLKVICTLVAERCPALETLIVDCANIRGAGTGPPWDQPHPEVAARCAAIVEAGRQGHSLPDTSGMPFYRSALLDCLGNSPPALHVLESCWT
jgi:hypothetical protein